MKRIEASQAVVPTTIWVRRFCVKKGPKIDSELKPLQPGLKYSTQLGDMAGIIAQLPEGESCFIPFALDPGEWFDVAGQVRQELDNVILKKYYDTSVDDLEDLSSAFQNFHLEDESDESDESDEGDSVLEYRVLFQGRDLESEKASMAFLTAMEGGKVCTVRVVFRLLGGKGGFGSLLRSQKGGKKTTNFDAMRDLNGRRVRHVKAVERIKEWLEKKKREDELVNLLTGEGPELPKPTSEADSVDPEYMRKLKRSAASRPGLVSEGLKHWDEEQKASSAGPEEASASAKRPRTSENGGEKSADEDEDVGTGWMDPMSALNGLSSEDEPSDEKAAPSSAASSSK